MNKRIIFKNDEGGVSVITPTQEALDLYGIEATAQKDVPFGKPYKIIDELDLPADRTFRNAWEADMTNPGGVGAESNAFTEVA